MPPFVRRIDRLRFEVPLAMALGLAAAFAAIAAPPGPLDPLPGGRWPAAIALLLVLTPLAWLAMRKRQARPATHGAAFAPDAAEEAEVAEPPVMRLRRADRHPDAPTPQPIHASRDLGTPFMAIVREPAAPAEDAPFEEIAETETVTFEEPPLDPPAPEPAPVEAAAPEPPAPEAQRAPRESLAAMMERLSKGVERRGGVPPRRTPEQIARAADQLRETQPALRDALATLNRLAERR